MSDFFYCTYKNIQKITLPIGKIFNGENERKTFSCAFKRQFASFVYTCTYNNNNQLSHISLINDI